MFWWLGGSLNLSPLIWVSGESVRKLSTAELENWWIGRILTEATISFFADHPPYLELWISSRLFWICSWFVDISFWKLMVWPNFDGGNLFSNCQAHKYRPGSLKKTKREKVKRQKIKDKKTIRYTLVPTPTTTTLWWTHCVSIVESKH